MKRLSLLICCVLMLFCLVGCDSESNAPSGMKLCRGSDALGYYLYVPEDWMLSNTGEIAGAYYAGIDTSSVSFARTDLPEDLDAFFHEGLVGLKDAAVTLDGEDCSFAGAEAKKYAFTFTVSNTEYHCLQYYSVFEGKLGILSYTAKTEVSDSYGKSFYDYHLEDITLILENFKYVSGGSQPSAKTYPLDADGWQNVSDGGAGFALWLSKEWTPEATGAEAGGKLPDGASVFLSRSGETGVSVTDYCQSRMNWLQNNFSDFSQIGEMNKSASLGNADKAVAIEYTFKKGETVYHVYQAVGIYGKSGYVFTYTAPEKVYASHLDEVTKIIGKVTFS